MTSFYIEQSPYNKVSQTDNGYCMFAGVARDYQIMRDAFELTFTEDENGNGISPHDVNVGEVEIDETSSMVFVPNYGGDCCLIDVDSKGCLRSLWVSPPVSIGSGSPFAMAAMVLGHSSERAVETAAKLDMYSGGEIKTIEVV